MPAFGRNGPDAEIRHLLNMSVGTNLAMDYLLASIMFDVSAGDGAFVEVASIAVWFDAFVRNVDRTPCNANLLLMWLGRSTSSTMARLCFPSQLADR
jgi:hypothetical protein